MIGEGSRRLGLEQVSLEVAGNHLQEVYKEGAKKNEYTL